MTSYYTIEFLKFVRLQNETFQSYTVSHKVCYRPTLNKTKPPSSTISYYKLKECTKTFQCIQSNHGFIKIIKVNFIALHHIEITIFWTLPFSVVLRIIFLRVVIRAAWVTTLIWTRGTVLVLCGAAAVSSPMSLWRSATSLCRMAQPLWWTILPIP